MRARLPVLGLILFAWTSLSGSAQAVTDIRFERWTVVSTTIARDTTPPIDSVTSVSVYFDARSTTNDLDPVKGLQFAIAERDPDGNDVLVRFAVAPCTTIPAPGSDIAIYASFYLYCDRAGRLRARDGVNWSVHWCEAPASRICYSNSTMPSGGLPAVSESEPFELVVLDENDREGSFATPEDALHADSGGPVGPEEEFVSPDFADSGAIGIFADPSGTLCSDVIQPLVPFRWYVVARLEGLLRCGVTILELGVRGLPQGLYINVTPNPRAEVVAGNLFTMALLGFFCEPGAAGSVVLYTLDGISSVPLSDVVLQIDSGDPPSNRFWPYPWAQTCPFIMGARRRMHGLPFIVNPSPGNGCEPTVHVETTTWERFKALYRTGP